MAGIIFAGTPDFAAVHLQALLEAGIRPVAVYTQPDRKAGRGHKLTPSAVKQVALEHNLPVFTPVSFKEEGAVEQFASFNADLCIVVAYGLLLPQSVLDAPRLGCINVHGSLLPRWRGAAPIQRALLSGDKETGICIMQLVKALDAGPVLYEERLPILPEDTSGTLFDRLAKTGAASLVKVLPDILEGKQQPVAQDESKVTYAQKLSKSECPLDFTRSASELALQVRGLNPWPVATVSLQDTVYKVFEAKVTDTDAVHSAEQCGTVLEVSKEGIEVACAQGTLCLEVIQAPGKGKCKAADFARSHQQLLCKGVKFN